MTSARRHPFVQGLLWIAVPVILLALLRPWTIRPLESVKPATFEATTFATSAWPRILLEASQKATDVGEIAGTSPRFVKGTGIVTAVDRQSRVGVIRVQTGGSRPVTVAIQIGPVIRGTALRDAASFIQFSDFTNQFDFASAANALNDQMLRTVIAPVPVDTLVRRTIGFTGAVGKSAPREDGALEVVPVHLTLVDVGEK